MSPPLLPDPIGEPTQETPVRRTVYNRPAWMVRGQQDEDTEIPEDASRKKSRAWVFAADIFTTPAANINPPMPLDVDNGLPGIELWFGKEENSEVGLLCHLDSWAAMNTGNLRVH